MAPAEPHAIPLRVKDDLPTFDEEREGWKGYYEWEDYPEKRKQVEEILAEYDFPVVRWVLISSHSHYLLSR